MDYKKLSIIIPVYNEINTVLEVLKRVQHEKHKKEIIIVDDGSNDGTTELLNSVEEPNVKILHHSKNKGKGCAIRTALPHITGDICIIQDADLEYYPDEYNILIEKILQNKADVTYGSRFLGTHRVFFFYHYLGNTALNLLANIFLNTNLTDLMTGYKACRTAVLRKIELHAEGFGFEAEFTAEVFKHKFRVYEVPISFEGRNYEEGKKIRWIHFFECVYWLIRSYIRGIDVGTETLLRMQLMKNNNRWCYEKIKPYLGDTILEIGSGIGTISKFLVNHGSHIILSDINEEYIQYLSGRFIGNPKVTVKQIDAATINQNLKKAEIDTIVGFNILEHIKDDDQTLQQCHARLSTNGRLLLIVPAHQVLFGTLDAALHHFRRYSKKMLLQKLSAHGFEVEKIEYMNAPAGIGWFLTYKIFRRKRMSPAAIRIADMLIPYIRFIETYISVPFGLSLVAVARKTG